MEKKLSKIIKEMIKPYYDDNTMDLEILISIASFSWNMCIIPEEQIEEFRKSILDIAKNEEEYKVMEELIGKFTQYKLTNYKDDRRFIVNYHVDTDSGSPLFQIVSTPYDNSEIKKESRSTKMPRNAICQCGSGKKYKKCCGK